MWSYVKIWDCCCKMVASALFTLLCWRLNCRRYKIKILKPNGCGFKRNTINYCHVLWRVTYSFKIDSAFENVYSIAKNRITILKVYRYFHTPPRLHVVFNPMYSVFTLSTLTTCRLTLCSETQEPGRSSVYRQVEPQISGRRDSVLPNCHKGTPLRTDRDPTLAQVWACLTEQHTFQCKNYLSLPLANWFSLLLFHIKPNAGIYLSPSLTSHIKLNCSANKLQELFIKIKIKSILCHSDFLVCLAGTHML